jgi:hypothetical protein
LIMLEFSGFAFGLVTLPPKTVPLVIRVPA